jgi:putative two-component system response regulator
VNLDDAAACVLVVDDDSAIRRMIARILGRAGYECTEAPDPAVALLFADTQEYSLVTCDINMPGGSGLGLVRDLRARHPDIAVLMVSGMDDPETAAVATDLGAYGYVMKPFESNEILIASANALRRRHLEIENRVHRQHLENLVAERTSDLTATIERLSRTERALRESQEEAIRRLAYAAEFRDSTTGAHINRMSRTCEILAARAGLGTERVELIRIASPMHDIGKIGVSDEVLRKPGKLSAEEMDEMRKHPLTTNAGTGQATHTGSQAIRSQWKGASWPSLTCSTHSRVSAPTNQPSRSTMLLR